MIEYWTRSFTEPFIDVSEVRSFIEQDLLDRFTNAVEANQGILLTRAS